MYTGVPVLDVSGGSEGEWRIAKPKSVARTGEGGGEEEDEGVSSAPSSSKISSG